MEFKFDKSVMLMIYGWSIMPIVLIQYYVIGNYELNLYLSPLYVLSVLGIVLGSVLMIKSIKHYAFKLTASELVVNNYLFRSKTTHNIKDIVSYNEKSLKIAVNNKERIIFLYNISPDDKKNLISQINESLEIGL